MTLHLLQIDEELWVNPLEIVAIFVEQDLTYISLSNKAECITDVPIDDVIDRLRDLVNLHVEE